MKVLTHLNLNKNELQNAVFQNLATAPGTPFTGQFYFDTIENILKIYNGTSWTTAGSSYVLPAATSLARGGIRIGDGLEVGTGSDADLLSVTNTGVVLDSDFTANGLMKRTGDGTYTTVTAPNGAVVGTTDVQTLINKTINGTDNTLSNISADSVIDGSTNHVFTALDDTKLSNVAENATVGADWETNLINIPTFSDVAFSNSYEDLDDLPNLALKADLVAGKIPANQLPSYVDDVVELLVMQTTAPGSGAVGDKYFNTTDKKIYTYNAGAWGGAEDPEQGKIYINLSENSTYRWSGSAMISISNPLDIASEAEAKTGVDNTKTMTPLRVAQHWAAHKFSQTIGNASSTSFVITHGLGTKDVSVSIQETQSPYEIVYTTIELTSDNAITVKFTSAPTTNAYRITVIG